jgi:hypothetical protein
LFRYWLYPPSSASLFLSYPNQHPFHRQAAIDVRNPRNSKFAHDATGTKKQDSNDTISIDSDRIVTKTAYVHRKLAAHMLKRASSSSSQSRPALNVKVYETTLKEGEVLYLPPFWMSKVRSKTQTTKNYTTSTSE